MFNGKDCGCKYNTENSSTTKIGDHITSVFSMSEIFSFKSIESKPDVYKGNGCMKKFCESLREHAIKIINFIENEDEINSKKIPEFIWNAKVCYIWKEKDEIYVKLVTIVIIQVKIDLLHMKYVV